MDTNALSDRIGKLTPDEFRAVFWQTFGGCEYSLEKNPNARIGEFFRCLDSHVSAIEKSVGTAAIAARLRPQAVVSEVESTDS